MSGIHGLTEQEALNVLTASQGFDEVIFSQVLDETDFATHAEWDVTGQWDDSLGHAALVFAAGAIGGTLTQINADQAANALNSKEYVFTYTVAVTIAPDGDFTLQLSGIPGVAVSLPYTAGTHSVYFQSAAAASAADFVITAAETTATQGSITIDNVSLTRCCDSLANPDCDEWWAIRAIGAAATVSATSAIGDNLPSIAIPENSEYGGRFSRVLVTAGTVLVYRV